jgi:hypothetical protein
VTEGYKHMMKANHINIPLETRRMRVSWGDTGAHVGRDALLFRGMKSGPDT